MTKKNKQPKKDNGKHDDAVQDIIDGKYNLYLRNDIGGEVKEQVEPPTPDKMGNKSQEGPANEDQYKKKGN